MHQNNIYFLFFKKIIFYISTSKLSKNIKKNKIKSIFLKRFLYAKPNWPFNGRLFK
jgi:hypothetical protein